MSKKNRNNTSSVVDDQNLSTDELNTEEEIDMADETIEPMPIDKAEGLVLEADKNDETKTDAPLEPSDELQDELPKADELPEIGGAVGVIGEVSKIGDALDQESIINQDTLDPIPELDPTPSEVLIKDEEPVIEEEPAAFSKEALVEILDSTVTVDDSKATIYNTVDDMIAAVKLEKIYKLTAKIGANNTISRVMSQALKFASTSADKRKGDVLFSTLIREINGSTAGKDFDLLMFVVTRTFKALRTFSEPAVVRSFREVKNTEIKENSLLLSHLISQLATADDRKKKIGVTISLDKAVRISPNGLNQNGASLVKDYFKK